MKGFPLFHLSPHLASSLIPNLGQNAGSEIFPYTPPLEPNTIKIPPNTWCPLRPLLFFAGWYEGERLRDGERGWFPMECAKEITCQATIDKNVERMGRLLGLETNV